jgi:hypothetical protein
MKSQPSTAKIRPGKGYELFPYFYNSKLTIQKYVEVFPTKSSGHLCD